MAATWDGIRERSASRLGSMDLHCGDCWMAWRAARLPCSKHATDEEKIAIDEHVRRTLVDLAMARSP